MTPYITYNMTPIFQVLLVTLSPQLKVVFTHPLKGAADCLPLLAWQFVIIQVTQSDRVVDPVLVFARESTIHFHQVWHCVCTSDTEENDWEENRIAFKL